MTWLQTQRATLWHGNALKVYERLPSASFELVISDGPYGIGKDRQWDPSSVDALPELYEPHVAAWGRLCKPGASVYLWGTAASWAAVHPVVLAHGWRFRALVTWDKGMASLAGRLDTEGCRTWPDVTEVAGFYQRAPFSTPAGPATHVAHAAGQSDDNWLRAWLVAEWESAGLRRKDADLAMGTNGMAGHYFGRSQWELPTWERYQQLATFAAEHGQLRDRPYLVHPDAVSDTLRASYDHLRAEYDHLRAEYEAARAPFTLPHGVTNVWRHPLVSGGERLRTADGSTLHPCQKPIAFYRRMIEASTRPGAQVLEPFGGTCRAAVAAQQVGDRHAVCIEMDEAYLRAVRPALQFVPPAGGLFA